MTLLNGDENKNISKFHIKAADFDAVFFILQNMRHADKKEILATEFDDDLNRIAQKFVQGCDMAWVFYDSYGQPIAFMGGVKLWPYIAQIGFVATNDWHKIAKPVSRWLYKNKNSLLRYYKIKHVFCFMDTQYKANKKWLSWLGFQGKGLLNDFGKNGENLEIMSLGCF